MRKSLRFDVFKRDGFQCVYCGRRPPDVVLHADHLVPVHPENLDQTPGNDTLENLVTSCAECNQGKSNVPLDRTPEALQVSIERAREVEEQLRAYTRFLRVQNKRTEKDIRSISARYSECFPGWELSPVFCRGSLRTFLKYLTVEEVLECLDIAAGKIPDKDRVIKYFCGVCWTTIKQRRASNGLLPAD